MSPAWQQRSSEAGVLMRRPRWSPNTQRVHEATAYARERGRDAQFHHAAARAYWESGADLGDPAVLRRLAEECGLDWSELGPRLESGHYRQRVLDQYEEARARGVSGTPTYHVPGSAPVFGDLTIDDLRGLIAGSPGS